MSTLGQQMSLAWYKEVVISGDIATTMPITIKTRIVNIQDRFRRIAIIFAIMVPWTEMHIKPANRKIMASL